MEEIVYNKIYARADQTGKVVHIFSEAFEQPQIGDICIDSTNTDRHGAQKYAVLDENGYFNYNIINGKLAERDKSKDIIMSQLDELRQQRELECFTIINRGTLWYETLNDTQKQQLKQWYRAWLDVTKTKIIPIMLYWLK